MTPSQPPSFDYRQNSCKYERFRRRQEDDRMEKGLNLLIKYIKEDKAESFGLLKDVDVKIQ